MNILKTEFRGDRGAVLFLCLKIGFLSLITLGIYWFWGRVNLRRWYWSATRPGGVAFEYFGTGLEKFSGFFIAMTALLLVGMAWVAGLLAFALSIGSPDGSRLGLLSPVFSLIFTLFLWNFARYRAWRYTLSRTRWRGIRFGMSSGALGYGVSGAVYGFLTLASGLLLLPLAHFRLEKYLTERSWYGNAQFLQHGSFLALYGPLVPLLVSVWGAVAFLAYGNLTSTLSANFIGMGLYVLAYPFALYYRVAALRVMVALKTLGDGIEFDLWPRTRSILWHWIIGGFLTSFTSVLATLVFSTMLFGALSLAGLSSGGIGAVLAEPGTMGAIMILPIMGFFTVAVFAFNQVFVICPIIQHAVETLEIHQPELLGLVRQRDPDTQSDADGFAQVLDAGGPI